MPTNLVAPDALLRTIEQVKEYYMDPPHLSLTASVEYCSAG